MPLTLDLALGGGEQGEGRVRSINRGGEEGREGRTIKELHSLEGGVSTFSV